MCADLQPTITLQIHKETKIYYTIPKPHGVAYIKKKILLTRGRQAITATRQLIISHCCLSNKAQTLSNLRFAQ